jgi:minor extracellular serine protease Vpr
MFRFLRFAVLTAIAICALALPFLNSSAVNSGTVSVIVELRDDPGAVYAAKAKQQGNNLSADQIRAYRNSLTVSQNQFLEALKGSGVNFQLQSVTVKAPDGSVAGNVPMRYTLVFNGLTLNVPASAVSTIRSMPQVKHVHANTLLYPDLVKSVDYIRAPKVYGKFPELTPFDNFREGFEGQGINIAVIDTGIDWTHPMFGGDPTPPRLGITPNVAALNAASNQKVIYQLPLTDIVTDGFGHGTHVASTAAGYLASAPGADGLPNTSDDIPIHGVAPQAKLMSYKVCSDVQSTYGSLVRPTIPNNVNGINAQALAPSIGGCSTSNIVMAIEDSVSPQTVDLQPKPIAHVINMSLGGGGGPDNPTAVASDNAALTGCVVVAAAGNSGPNDGTLGAPAAGSRVIAVAANTDPGSNAGFSADVLAPAGVNRTSTTSVTPAKQLSTASGQRDQILLTPMSGPPAPPQGSMAQYYVFVKNGQTLDEWPSSVKGRIALVKVDSSARLPRYTFAQIVNNGAASGAVAVILISTSVAGNAVTASVPGLFISVADGEYLVDLLSSTDNNAVDPANGALSEFPIRLNPFFGTVFVGDTAGFSSRGPVQGFGQVKPDISAPGVNVLAAMPPASLLGALSLGNYGAISGTSMATPHMAGSVALVKQAHLDWTPDMVRTAIINTATNMRTETGSAKPDGPGSESILAQGGGLVDVYKAVKTKALMGVAGDGVAEPSILGSHSYGQVPVVNNRTTSTQSVTVTIQDVSGEGGTYNLSVANNRDLQLSGINVNTSANTVSVPANGSATFTVDASFDGNLIRDVNTLEVNGTSVTFRPIQMQWYVTAQSGDGNSLRMPFYFKPAPSLPATPVMETQTFTGTILAGDRNRAAQSGVDYMDFPIQVTDTTFKIEGRMNFDTDPAEATDLDFFLYDPDGRVIASGATDGNPESLSTLVFRGGTYKYRVTGYQNAATNFTITSTLSKGPAAPAAQTIAGDFVDAQGQQVDFDGVVNLQWIPAGGELGFEIEKTTPDNPEWQFVADVDAGATSYAFTLANGQYSFRVRGIQPGQIGKYITQPGNAVAVIVDQRSKVDITSLVTRAVSNVLFTGGVFQLDLTMTNTSAQSYVPLVDMNVVGITSTTGVRVINADNGKPGNSLANAALFGYSQKIGSDQVFSSSEVSAPRTLRFQDSAAEMFNFDAMVTAYLPAGGSSGSAGAASSSQQQASSGSDPTVGLLKPVTGLMRFTANPLTKTVTVQLVSLK